MEKNKTKASAKKSIFGKHWYSNIYLYLSLIFIVWMFFIDTNSYLTHKELNNEISKLKHEKDYYKSKLDSENIQYENLKNNREVSEKYAREKYFFKKLNEDIFIIITKDNSINSKSNP